MATDLPQAPPPAPAPGGARRTLETLLAYWPVPTTMVAGLALSAALSWSSVQQAQMRERELTAQELTLVRTRLEAVAQTTFSPTVALEAMIQLDKGISQARFEALADKWHDLIPHLRSIVAAPDDIARYVYPLKGNQAVLNLDYRSIPAQYAQVQAAQRSGKPVLVGPVNLVQGGRGLIQRYPVFLGGDSKTSQPYWGVVSVVADLDRFMQSAGLSAHPHLDFVIHEADASGAPGKLIWGTALAASDSIVRQPLNVPGADWMISAMPSSPDDRTWPWASAQALLAVLATMVLSWQLALLTYRRRLLHVRNQQLSEEIHASKSVQAELEASQSRFRSLATMASDWVWEQDAQFRFTFLSRSGEEATQVQSNHLLGLTRWESPASAPDVDWAAHRASLERHESFKDFEYAQYTESGELRWVSISGAPFFDRDGRFMGYRGTGRNITPAKLAEAALRQSEAALKQARDRLQAVLDAAIEMAVIATDLEGRINLFNRGAQRMLGYQPEELMGQTPVALHLRSELQAREQALRAEHGLQVSGFECFVAIARRDGSDTQPWTYVRKDGSQLDVMLTVTPVLDADQAPMGYLGVARDVSAQVRAERELRRFNEELESRVAQRTAELSKALSDLRQAQDELLRSEKLAALGSLVAGVAHELNTPLGNCLTAATTLDARTLDIRQQFDSGQIRRSSLQSYLDDAAMASSIMHKAMETATELLSHFKQVSVDQASAQRREFELASVVADVLSIMRPRLKKSPVQIQVDIPPELRMDSYPGPLGQVITNLVMNAVLHAFEGRSQGTVSIRAQSTGDQLELTVSDDGLGMSDEVRRRAFDPFFTTKMGRGGTGLGLNIVYNIVTTMLGGQVELHSVPGEGSRFVFKLPLVAPKTSRPGATD